MRVIPKKLVEEMARLTRKYAGSGDVDILPARTKVAIEIANLLGDELLWSSICALFGAMCGVRPLKHCSNIEIIYVLHFLGIDVEDDEKGGNNGSSNGVSGILDN